VTQQRPATSVPRAADGEPLAGAALRAEGLLPQASGWPRARVLLLLVCVALVVHGSLYPYRFVAPASFREALAQMLAQRHWWTSRGDVLGNVVLFMPLGLLGQWVLELWLRPRAAAAVMVMVAGAAAAFGLQVAQIYLPDRDAELADVLWNTVGLALGLAAAQLTPAARLGLGGVPLGHSPAQSVRLRLAAALAVLWLSLNWWPFVPTLDWAHVKFALRAVAMGLNRSAGSLSALSGAALAVVVIGHLLHSLPHRRRTLAVLCGIALLGRLLTVGQWLSASLLLGVLGGLLLAEVAWRADEAKAGRVLFWAVVLWFALDALRPYQLATVPHAMHWQPFKAMLHGSMLSNLLSLCWNLFWIGAAVSLAAGSARPLLPVTLAVSAGVAGLELAQTHLPGRVADITPALLPALWWLVVRAVAPRSGGSGDGA
jgi:VanZ family protein